MRRPRRAIAGSRGGMVLAATVVVVARKLLHDRRAQVGAAAAIAGAGAAAARRATVARRDDGRGESRAYRLRPAQRPADEVRRVARGRAAHALDELGAYDERGPDSVHEARKDLKKLRSLLRLVRGRIDDDVYRAENERFRDAGRRLSGTRDAAVKLETLRALRDRLPALEPYAEALAGEREEATAAAGGTVRAAREEIAAGREAISSWALPRGRWSIAVGGLVRAYARGRDALRAVREGGGDEAVHEWRKRAKDHWYHLRLLREAWPAVLGPLADEAHRLSELLGDHHDLAVLADDARGRGRVFRSEAERATLLDAIRTRQAEVLEQALPLGERLYAESPKSFGRRIDRCWRAAVDR